MLARGLVKWFDTTLIETPGRAPANKANAARGPNILETIDEPGGAARAAEMLAEARKRDPQATLFPEAIVNQLGYEHLAAGDKQGAIAIFKLNVTAFPDSANTYDSLADAYVADGQTELAIENAEKTLKVLEADSKTTEQQRKLIREAAEQKLKQLRRGE